MSETAQGDLRPLEYELPSAPQNLVNSWVTRLQAVAIVTALLAQIEAGLVGGMASQDPETATDVAARFFGYSGLILNLGATLSAVLLLLAVTSIPTASRRLYMSCSHGYPRKIFEYNSLRRDAPPAGAYTSADTSDYEYLRDNGGGGGGGGNNESDLSAAIRSFNQDLFRGNTEETILDAFGMAAGWGLMLRHCILCFLGGCVATFVHVTVLLWMNESTVVAAILMPVVFLGFVPPVVVYLFGMDSKKCPQCEADRSSTRLEGVQVYPEK